MRVLYGAPPDPGRELRRLDAALEAMPEEEKRKLRQIGERIAFGKALFNALAPLTGEDPLP